MRPEVAIIYNEPVSGRYQAMGEEKAVLGVLEAVAAVDEALTGVGYPVARVPLAPPLERARERLASLKTDLVFNLFEGFADSPESEAAVADILSALRLTFTGCPGAALALALNKAKTKELLQASRIATPRFNVLSLETLSRFSLRYPCIVKPVQEDASHGLSEESVVPDFAALKRQMTRVSQLFGGQALVEEFLDGREFNATVIGCREPVVLPVSEIVYTLPPGLPRLLTYAAKWEEQSLYFRHSTAVCPAEVEAALSQRIADIARRVFNLVIGSGYARVDFRLDAAGLPQVIEVNPNPDISPSAGAGRQAAAAGMSYAQFIEKIVLLALEKA